MTPDADADSVPSRRDPDRAVFAGSAPNGEPGLLMATYAPAPVRLVRGEGSWVWDDRDRRFLDFISGLAVTSLGHCHPAVVAAVTEQAARLWHVSNLYLNDLAEPLAQRIDRVVRLPESTAAGKVFFANSGAEANEAAIKLVRRHCGPRRNAIVSTMGAFHGRTLGALAATGQPSKSEAFEPLPDGFLHVPYGDLDAVEQALGPSVGAVMVEPVQGEAGVVTPPPGYLRGLRRLCDERGVLLVVDEIQTGLCRTGAWLASHHEAVQPDVVTLAKALANGMPIGACWATADVAASFRPGDHGTTFGGQPLAAAAAIATLDTMEREHVASRAAESGAVLRESLENLDGVAHVRGAGLLVGAVLEPGAPPSSEVVRACLDGGLLLNSPAPGVIRMAPSLLVNADEIGAACAILSGVLAGSSAPASEGAL